MSLINLTRIYSTKEISKIIRKELQSARVVRMRSTRLKKAS